MSGILIIGAGGHAKVVADILMLEGKEVLGFLDDQEQFWGQTALGLPILGPVDSYRDYQPSGLALGVGDNKARKAVVERLGEAARPLWQTAIHPHSVVARAVEIGPGTVVCAGALIKPETTVGAYVIINAGVTLAHDCVVEDYVHIAPGSNISGYVTIGEGVFVGAGAISIPSCAMGEWSTIGAGAVVTKNIPPGVIAKGAPARWQ